MGCLRCLDVQVRCKCFRYWQYWIWSGRLAIPMPPVVPSALQPSWLVYPPQSQDITPEAAAGADTAAVTYSTHGEICHESGPISGMLKLGFVAAAIYACKIIQMLWTYVYLITAITQNLWKLLKLRRNSWYPQHMTTPTQQRLQHPTTEIARRC